MRGCLFPDPLFRERGFLGWTRNWLILQLDIQNWRQLDGIPKMRRSLVDGSLAELRSIGHNMKGTAGSYGFPDLTAL
jgi:hypothetical protein